MVFSSVNPEMTIEQAADAINVSQAFLLDRLESGEIPFTGIDEHRRIRSQDLMDYKERVDRLRDAALDELAAIDQELFFGCDG